jgi:hypothetical protein
VREFELETFLPHPDVVEVHEEGEAVEGGAIA